MLNERKKLQNYLRELMCISLSNSKSLRRVRIASVNADIKKGGVDLPSRTEQLRPSISVASNYGGEVNQMQTE